MTPVRRSATPDLPPGPGAETGSAALLLVVGLGVVLALGALLAVLAGVAVAHHRAAAAADLAALAAADRALGGLATSPGDGACALAGRVARAHGATLTRCGVDTHGSTLVVTVTVALPLRGPAGRLGPVRATARARPG